MVWLVFASMAAFGQGTKLWSVERFDEMERGSADGVAIRSDGRLSAGPAISLRYSSDASYIWSLATSPEGVNYVGLGGTTAGSAAVMQVQPNGVGKKIFSSGELSVQALRRSPDGSLFAATAPDGKVYRIATGGGEAQVVFDSKTVPEKPRFLWDLAVSPAGDLYVAAGAPAAVYRVHLGKAKAPELLFRTADQHIRSLLLAPDGTLWAGSDGEGVIYRFDTEAAGSKPVAAYTATKREVTALTIDAAGDVFAAGVGNKGPVSASGLPPLPVTGSVGVSVAFVAPGSAGAATSNSVVADGSEIYRIAPDGTPSRLLSLHDDVVYALAFRKGRILIGSGNRGRIYEVDPQQPGTYTDVAHLGATQATVFAETRDGLLVGTSNTGKLYRMADAPAEKASYTSEVFDAGASSRWGRLEAQYETAGFNLFVRTGNVPNPLGGWSDWVKVRPNEGPAGVPEGRYAQWRAEFHGAAELSAVGLNYLQRNVAPVVDEVVVAPGARVTNPSPSFALGQPATVQIVIPSTSAGAQAISLAQEPRSTPLTAQKDRTAITVRWTAHDDNGDDLLFRVLYRGQGETVWRLLKDNLSDRFLSFDSALLPDGPYQLKIVASDAPVHLDADTLTGERVSSGFVIDTAPPALTVLAATRATADRLHATFEARDLTSPIAHAEYSLDAGPWQYLEPVGSLSDSLLERYDWTVSLPSDRPAAQAEHVLAVRVYDRFENMASAKIRVR